MTHMVKEINFQIIYHLKIAYVVLEKQATRIQHDNADHRIVV